MDEMLNKAEAQPAGAWLSLEKIELHVGKKNSKDPKLLGDNIFWIKEKICGIKKLVKKVLINLFSIVYRSTSWG